jgi:hypothetical protein
VRERVPAGLAFLLVLVVLCVPTAGGPTAASRSGPSVDVVGDSLVTQASADLTDRLAAAGLDAAVVHRPAQDLGSTFVQEQLVRLRAGRPADVLVIATAANDALRDHDRSVMFGPGMSVEWFAEQVGLAIAPFADRCVVLVNAREDTAPVYHPDSARVVNGVLDRVGQRHPNVVVVDWAGISRRLPPDWFAADQLHFGLDPTTASIGSGSAREYANAIVDGVHRCLQRT